MNSAQTQITSAKRAPMAMVTALLLAISGHLNSWAWSLSELEIDYAPNDPTNRTSVNSTGNVGVYLFGSTGFAVSDVALNSLRLGLGDAPAPEGHPATTHHLWTPACYRPCSGVPPVRPRPRACALRSGIRRGSHRYDTATDRKMKTSGIYRTGGDPPIC